MGDKLISFNTAKLAKEKGFSEITENFFLYEKRGTSITFRQGSNKSIIDNIDIVIYRTTQTNLQKWLRENFKLHIQIYYGVNGWNANCYNLETISSIAISIRNIKTYEGALEDSLYELLKYIEK